MSEPKPDGKPFAISKRLVWEAWRRVKANRGAAGVDEESIQAFEAKEHLVGVGLAFPEADDLTPQSYVSVELPGRIEQDPWEPGGDDDATEREPREETPADGA